MSLDSAIKEKTEHRHFGLEKIGEIIDNVIRNSKDRQLARTEICARFNVPIPIKEAGVKSRRDLACYIHDTLYPHCCDCYYDQF